MAQYTPIGDNLLEVYNTQVVAQELDYVYGVAEPLHNDSLGKFVVKFDLPNIGGNYTNSLFNLSYSLK